MSGRSILLIAIKIVEAIREWSEATPHTRWSPRKPEGVQRRSGVWRTQNVLYGKGRVSIQRRQGEAK